MNHKFKFVILKIDCINKISISRKKVGTILKIMQQRAAKIENSSRLETLLSALKMSQKDFAAEIGVAPSGLSQYITGERALTAKAALKITAKFKNVNFQWLMSGEGSMFKPSARGNAGENMVEMLGEDVVRESEELGRQDERRSVNESTEPELVRMKRENEKLREYNLRLTEQVARLAELVGQKME